MLAAWGLRLLSSGGRVRRLPLAGAWTEVRDFPAPEGGTFMDRYRPDADGKRRGKR